MPRHDSTSHFLTIRRRNSEFELFMTLHSSELSSLVKSGHLPLLGLGRLLLKTGVLLDLVLLKKVHSQFGID